MKTKYLTLEQVLLIHELQIQEYGGDSGIRDLGLLESAIFRPQSSFGGKDLYKTTFDKAAVLIQSIILNHSFVDGNKRTGSVAGLVFLELNGFELSVKQEELVEFAKLIAQNKMNVEKISNWLKYNSKRRR